jgi:hypothetical protein
MAAKNDLVQSICKGEGKRFRGVLCEYYELDTEKCELLRDELLHAVFEKGRCQPLQRIVRPLVAKHLIRYGYHHACQDFHKNVNALAEGFTEQYIRNQRLHKGYTLYVLRKFINEIVYCKILDYVQQEGLLPKMVCGECVHLSREKPHICERMTITGEKDTKEIPNPFYQQKRTPGERACKEGFEPYTFTSVDSIGNVEHSPDDGMQQQIVFEHWAFLLAKRVEHATTAEDKKIFGRQHIVFGRMAQLRWEGFDWPNAITRVADECGVNPRTIKRDLHQIKQFLRTKCPEWFKSTDFIT